MKRGCDWQVIMPVSNLKVTGPKIFCLLLYRRINYYTEHNSSVGTFDVSKMTDNSKKKEEEKKKNFMIFNKQINLKIYMLGTWKINGFLYSCCHVSKRKKAPILLVPCNRYYIMSISIKLVSH